MNSGRQPGQIVILNGAPRSGKSSIVEAIQQTFEGAWMNLGVDLFVRHVTPPPLRPGIGLRPGGERPDLEPFVRASYAAMYDSIAAHSRAGLNVVVDVGHHDAYSRPMHILGDCACRLEGLPVLFVAVRCPIEVIMQRRNMKQDGRDYVSGTQADPVPAPVLRWQQAVHTPDIYDLQLDTAQLSPAQCALAIQQRLRDGPPGTAFQQLAAQHLATNTNQ